KSPPCSKASQKHKPHKIGLNSLNYRLVIASLVISFAM
ncbi:MAG: hypothetical protein ACI8X3_001144, partial [Saprospiraceae bacterium]